MNQEVADRIDSYAAQGWNLESSEEYRSWLRRLVAFLDAVAEQEVRKSIEALGGLYTNSEWHIYRDRQVSHLEGIAITLRSRAQTDQLASVTAMVAQQISVAPGNRVFLVHGHDVAAKESVARFLEKLSLTPVILHEQANEGQTVIEKFESHANVNFAVVLLTPDDVGASGKTPTMLLPRARQNVVLELGYFTGKLGRRKVCALFNPGVEVPSDFHGVLFIELDVPGAWKAKLAQELVSAGMQINLQGLLT